MPATSFVRVHRKSLYYARPERTLYDSSDDIRNVWDGSQESEEAKEKESTDDELIGELEPQLESMVESPTVLEQRILGDSEQSWKLLEALNALASFPARSRAKSALELTSLVDALVQHVVAHRTEHVRRCKASTTDGLCCPICEGVLRYPVTATCGHTFCRQCCFGHSRCTVCGQRFPSAVTATLTTTGASSAFTSTPSSSSATVTSANYAALSAPSGSVEGTELVSTGGGFELDILIRRLVERWWGPELKAADLQEEAQRHLEDNSLDEALRCCNQSLEHVPNSAKGLQLRSEVLHRLQHYQSALADADSALKCLPTSHKAYYNRAISLSALGKYEEAVIARCISIFLDRQSHAVSNGIKSELMQDLKRLLQDSSSLASRSTLNDHNQPGEDDNPLGSIFDHSYDLIAGCRKRRHHRSPQRRKSKKQFLTLRQGDFDEDHSDYGGEDYLSSDLLFDYMEDPFSEESLLGPAHTHRRQHRSHHRRRRKSGSSMLQSDLKLEQHLQDHQYHQAQQQQQQQQQQQHQEQLLQDDSIIPQTNPRLKTLLERLDGELKSTRWLDTTPVRLTVNPSLIEPSDFDCVLCCRTLWRPVVTPCGHTYCWVCLDRCMDYSSSCPLCMAPLVEQFRNHQPGSPSGTVEAASSNPSNTPTNLISLTKRKMTRFVDLAMQRFIPEAYERRQLQEQDREPTVPVFICTTAFPSVPCPLFVYEQRYRLMVRRAIESGERRFGIALPAQNGRQRYVEYGTMLDIRDCVQLGDGCSILSTVGGRRFRVLTRHERDGYDTAHVEFFEDEKIGAGSEADERLQLVRDLHEKVLLKAIDWHQSLPESIRCEIFKSFGKMPDLEENWEDVTDGPAWAWWIIAILPLNDKLKVDILSTTSLKKRLRAIDKTLNLESAQQKRQRSVCVMAGASSAACCEGLSSTQQCQAIDCCLRERTTSSVHNHHHHHHHHHDSDRASDSTQHHHLHHHHHHHHLSTSADEYLL
ncbi:LON peptidase N-terminal domain and RING finger protein 1 [Anopheles maculipalpis]|uniref:LON peptidase N-terminal domain and RING finger protein 1 n=1 Tax=Anopheles maculipalpis TaxID=1496333 RepID=UPI0021592B9D|nr:LON peptidase N-terminal domain and RING finger protein 1 [Anopheles maculipalpis]